MNNLLSKAIISIPSKDWDTIKHWTKGRSGVYGFVNNITGNCYIGSGVDLYNRIRDYHQPWYLESRSNVPIVRAINKHGMDNFTLVLLEFTTEEGAVPAEQVWLDKYLPEYNVLSLASSSLGYNHTDEDKAKISLAMSGKPRSEDVRKAMSERQKGAGNTFYGMSHTDEAKSLLRAYALEREVDPNPGSSVIVLDTLTNITTTYKSLRKAAEALKCTRASLQKYNGMLFKDRYHITVSAKNR